MSILTRHFARGLGAVVTTTVIGLATLAAPMRAQAQSTGLVVTEGTAEAPKFYGLHFDLGIYDSSGLNSVGQNYYNAFSFYFEPSWDIGHTFKKLRSGPLKSLTLAARFIVTANVSGTDPAGFSSTINTGPQGTCSNIVPSANGGIVDPTEVQRCNPAAATRRADYSDFWLTLRAPGIYKIPKLGVNINPSVRFIFPTSEQSRYANLATSITPMLGLSRAFWKNRIRTGFSFGVNANIRTGQQAKTQVGSQADVATLGGNPHDGLIGGGISTFGTKPSVAGTEFSLLSVISGGVQFNDKWSLDIFYILSNAYRYKEPCNETINGMIIDVCATGNSVANASGSFLNRPGRVDSQTLWVSLGYQPWDFMGFSLSWINSAPLLNEDSTYRQGIYSFDYNGFTSVNFGTSISIDAVADRIIQKRKKKNPTPVAQSNAVSLQ